MAVGFVVGAVTGRGLTGITLVVLVVVVDEETTVGDGLGRVGAGRGAATG